MKIKNLKEIIKIIIKETVDLLHEYHQSGEYWIDSTGSAIYAEGNIGEFNHEGYVINTLTNEIAAHFGIEDAEGTLDEYEDQIKDKLLHEGRLSEDEIAGWDNMSSSKYNGPTDIIIKKLIEDKAYKTPEQAENAVFIAYNSSHKDARDYAMKYWRWKIMKTSGNDIDIQTWHLKPEDLSIIAKGIEDIMEYDIDDPDDPDNEIGPDGYTGPRINVTVETTGKRYEDIPLAVLEKKHPTSLNNYKSGLPWELAGINTRKTKGLKESFYITHKNYSLYEGNDSITAIFEDNDRLVFDVHFRNNHGEKKEKWRKKAMSKWKSIANEIHNNSELNEIGNPIEKTWKESFKEALEDPRMEPFIRNNHNQRLF